jgi:hypothetical protein
MFFHFYILIRDSQIANSKLQNKVKFSNFLKLSSVAPQIGGFFLILPCAQTDLPKVIVYDIVLVAEFADWN